MLGKPLATRLVWSDDVLGETRGALQGGAGGGVGGDEFERVCGRGVVEGDGVRIILLRFRRPVSRELLLK